MRIGSNCFNGFVKSLLLIDGIILQDSDYNIDPNGYIYQWNDVDIEYHAMVYIQS